MSVSTAPLQSSSDQLTIDQKVDLVVTGVRRFSYTIPSEVRNRLGKFADAHGLERAEVEAKFVIGLKKSLADRPGPIPTLIAQEWKDQLGL